MPSEVQGLGVAKPREAAGGHGDHEALVVEIEHQIFEALAWQLPTKSRNCDELPPWHFAVQPPGPSMHLVHLSNVI